MGISKPSAQVVAGLVIVGLLAWMTTISEDAGNVAVGVLLALWLMWSIRNVSAIDSLKNKLGV